VTEPYTESVRIDFRLEAEFLADAAVSTAGLGLTWGKRRPFPVFRLRKEYELRSAGEGGNESDM
jgi:hypothetical protein